MERITSKVLAAVVLALVLVVSSCKKDEPDEPTVSQTSEYSSKVATDWATLMLDMTRSTPGFTPPVAARAFGYTGLGLYESVRFGMPGYKSMAGQVNELNAGFLPEAAPNVEYHWGAVANATLATILRGCYVPAAAANEQAIATLELNYNQQFQAETSTEVFDRSVAFGKEMGLRILEYAKSDNQVECYKNNFPASYVPPTGTGMWVPTPPAFQGALQPYWGEARPFLTKNVTETQPVAPPAYSIDTASNFYKECREVYDAVTNLTPEQLLIAKYWSDDPGLTATPPGHSVSILRQVLIDEQADLALAAEAFAKLGMSVHDAFISCWKSKFTYNLIRPITVIHAQMDTAFTTPVTTPPFPEYTSGHSVQSGAASQVLTDMFGNHYGFTDYTHQQRTDINGSPRHFNSFYDFADEAAISRLYGGIHYRSAIELGVEQGRKVGVNISQLSFK